MTITKAQYLSKSVNDKNACQKCAMSCRETLCPRAVGPLPFFFCSTFAVRFFFSSFLRTPLCDRKCHVVHPNRALQHHYPTGEGHGMCICVISIQSNAPFLSNPTSTKLSSKIKQSTKALSKHTKKHFQTTTQRVRGMVMCGSVNAILLFPQEEGHRGRGIFWVCFPLRKITHKKGSLFFFFLLSN